MMKDRKSFFDVESNNNSKEVNLKKIDEDVDNTVAFTFKKKAEMLNANPTPNCNGSIPKDMNTLSRGNVASDTGANSRKVLPPLKGMSNHRLEDVNYKQHDSSRNNGEIKHSNRKSFDPTNSNKKNKKKKKLRNKIALVFIFFMSLLFISIISILLNSKPIHFVVVGIDQRDGQTDAETRADAIMSVSAGLNDKKILVASIPRDTYSYIECNDSYDKINHSYVYGATNWEKQGGGIACLVATMQTLTEVDYNKKYVKVNFAEMIKIIDAIGGIELRATASFCEMNASGERNSVCFVEGETYTMDGEMALSYSRHRKSDNDIERGLRQQEVFKAMLLTIKEKSIISWPFVLLDLNRLVHTNLNAYEQIQLAINFVLKSEFENYEFDWGTFYSGGVSYVELSDASLKEFTQRSNTIR